MKITIGKIKEGAWVAVLLRRGDVPWELPQNVPFHAEGIITGVARGKGGKQKYKVFVPPSRDFVVDRSQIKPLPFKHPTSEMALRNWWNAYIAMTLLQYLGYLWKKFKLELRVIRSFL